MIIKKISIIHHSHADYGYTDHPAVAARLQSDFVARALELIKKSSLECPFRWTCEVLEPLLAYCANLHDAGGKMPEHLRAAIDSGALEVCCLPFNMTPFLTREEWDLCYRWIPDELEELRDHLKCTCLMQTDVNGIPRAAVHRALDAGVKYLWTGPNRYLADYPFPPHTLFYWKQPDGRRILVYMNASYNNGFYVFNDNWRRGPIPAIGDMTYRAPTSKDYFKADRKSLLEAHRHCLEHLATIEKGPAGINAVTAGANALVTQGNYPYEIFPVSVTGQWRYDNDPPFEGLAEFVYEWNKLGLSPSLEFSTPSRILAEMEERYADVFPEYEGEWTDWWGIGSMSMPLAQSAARDAERTLRKINRLAEQESSFKCDKTGRSEIICEECLRDLVWFKEHTYGYWGAEARPDTRETVGQACKKQNYAFEAQALARWQLSEIMRPIMTMEQPGLTVANVSNVSTERWVSFETEALRHPIPKMVRDETTSECHSIYPLPGTRNFVQPKPEHCSIENTSQLFADAEPDRIWGFFTGVIPAQTIRRFTFCDMAEVEPKEKQKARITVDDKGWPTSVSFTDGEPLFKDGIGNFVGFTVDGFGPRWEFRRVFYIEDPDERLEEARRVVKQISAVYGKAERFQEGNTIVFTQGFSHPFLLNGWRRLEVYPTTRQMVFKLHVNRLPTAVPQRWYLQFPLNTGDIIPTLTEGGEPFQPGIDQIPGSCQEFYAIDGTAVYGCRPWTLAWSSEDAAMVSFGNSLPGSRQYGPLKDVNMLNAVLFDDFWDTNFAIGAQGPLDFTFHLAELPSDISSVDALHIGEELTHSREIALHN